jgi:hypothetical protein
MNVTPTVALVFASIFAVIYGASLQTRVNSQFAKQNATIVGYTFEVELSNNSIIHIDPNTGKFVKTFPFPVFQYSGGCVDSNRRKYLAIATNEIALINADTFLIEDHYSIPQTPTEISFDAKLNATFGIVIGRDRQSVANVDWFSGAVTPLVYFDGYEGVILGTSCYDPVRHVYYVGSSDDSGKNLYLRIDVVKKTMTEVQTGGNLLDNARVDTNRDRMIGYLNSTLYAIEGLSTSTPKLVPLMKFPGLPLLYAGAIDTASDRYYIGMLYFWLETKTFIAFDLKSNKMVFNNTIYMSPFAIDYLPAQN